MQLLEERFPAVAGGSAVAVFAAPRRRAARQLPAEPSRSALAQVAGSSTLRAVGDPFAADRVSADGRIAFAEITLDVPSTELGRHGAAAMAAALEPARAGGVTAELGGEAAFLNGKKASGAEGLGLLAALVILVSPSGRSSPPLVPIVLALVAVAVGLAASRCWPGPWTSPPPRRRSVR